jgi:hypothetical protein
MPTPPDPTNPDLLLNTRSYLIAQGIVRDPRDSSNSLPPMWIDRRQGVPGPTETEGLAPVEVGQTLVVGISKATGTPSAPYEGFIRRDHIEFIVRAVTANLAYAFENQVRTVLNDKRGWMMASVPVDESLLYRDLAPVVSDQFGWTFTMEYQISLWGPFTPVGP